MTSIRPEFSEEFLVYIFFDIYFPSWGTVTGTVRGLYEDRTGTVRGPFRSVKHGIHMYKFAYLLVSCISLRSLGHVRSLACKSLLLCVLGGRR